MDPVHNYGACVDIETARCTKRKECKPSFDKKTCIAFYEEFCRTRRLKGPNLSELTETDINECIAAIDSVECTSFEALGTFNIDETECLIQCDFIQPVSDSGVPGYCNMIDIADYPDGGV